MSQKMIIVVNGIGMKHALYKIFRDTRSRHMCSTVSTIALLFCSLAPVGCGKGSKPSPGTCNAPDEYTLTPPVILAGQEEANWCWAATGQMVMAYLGQTLTQCSQVNDRYGMHNCCTAAGGSSPCSDKTGWPQFCKHEVNASIKHNAGLSWQELKQQLGCKKVPVAFSWRWADGVTGHMMVAVGYGNESPDQSGEYLLVNNPSPVKTGQVEKIYYGEYLSDSASNSTFSYHTHWDDFYNFEVKPGVSCKPTNSE